MKIELTFRDILRGADWDSFCERFGYNPYMLHDGLASGDEVVIFLVDEEGNFFLSRNGVSRPLSVAEIQETRILNLIYRRLDKILR